MRLEGRLICGMDIVHAVIGFGPVGSYIDISNYYTKSEIDAGKQDKLVSGTNIRTINGNSVLGSGNINIQGSAVQSDWSVTDTSSMAYIKNKPTIPAAQVNADWDAASGVAQILNKPTIPDLATYCPIIEDTRSSSVAAITGTAPFSSLTDGQRIVLHFKYRNEASPTLQLTLSGGTTTAAIPLYQNYNNGVNALTVQAMPAGSFGEFIFDSTNSRWVLLGKDFNTTYSNTSQSDINNSAQGSRLIEPKLLRDNFYLKSEVNSAIVNSNPVIEDTRSSAVAAITGVAPFNTLVDGQKIVVKLKYKTSANATLTLTGLTNALPIYARCNTNDNSGITPIYINGFVASSYMELIYDATNSRWICTNYDRVMTYEALTQSRIDSSSTAQCVITGKLLRDNFYLKSEIDTAIGAKADKVQEVEVTGTTPTQTLAPNTFYKFISLPTSLALTLGTPIDGITNIYAFSFVAGAANPTISLPASVTIDGTPSIASGDYVEFNIMNNVALFKVVSI